MKNIIFNLILVNSIFSVFIGTNYSQEVIDTSILNTSEYKLREITISNMNKNDVVSSVTINQLNKANIAIATSVLPSVILSRSGARNESTVFLRGFDIRSVPIFIDGIPVYLPYDGYIDLGRFMVSDISKIEVSKGYSSILYGPNTIGGAINLISSVPSKKLELEAETGIFTGNGINSILNIGSKYGKFYFQGNFSKIQRDYIILSKEFDTSIYQTNHKLENSYTDDSKMSLKIGFIPKGNDEYSINFISQNGDKGNPIYLGTDASIKKRFWQWPEWNKQSIYFISKTEITDKLYMKSRFFYDKFANVLISFDDKSYTTRKSKSAFKSHYDDYSYGANLESGVEIDENNLLKFAVHYKNDTHREYNEGEPQRTVADYTISIGAEEVFSLIKKLKIIPGISYNMRNSLLAQEYNPTSKEVSELPENKNSATNIQIAFYYNICRNVELKFTSAKKTRFATMKDRYSYKIGTAIPNPDLDAESAYNFEFGSQIHVNEKFVISPSVYYSALRNTIQFINNVQPGISQMQNTGKSMFYGADFSLLYKIHKSLSFNLNYTFILRKNVTNPELKFTDVPDHNIFAYFDFVTIKNLNFIFSAQFCSDRYSTSYGNISPGFDIYNLQLSYNFSKPLKLKLGVNNIFDNNYTISEGYPEEGRNYYLSMSYKFDK
jgi:iron complex outermembrane receptor protein